MFEKTESVCFAESARVRGACDKFRGRTFALSAAASIFLAGYACRNNLCIIHAQSNQRADTPVQEGKPGQCFNIVRRVDGETHDINSRVRPSSLVELASALDQIDVLLIGEVHDDAEAHRLELELLREAHALYGSTRRIILSLEMFERDVQPVLDEYLHGIIDERSFVCDARAWKNYADYRGLIEFAKEKNLPVVAANAPRRYVSMVGKRGSSALDVLPTSSRLHLPPLPVVSSSAAYEEKFNDMMCLLHDPAPSVNATPSFASPSTPKDQVKSAPGAQECPYIGFSSQRSRQMLEAQNLWDATMAYSIAQCVAAPLAPPACDPKGRLLTHQRPLILHVCGKFHCESVCFLLGLGSVCARGPFVDGARAAIIGLKVSMSLPCRAAIIGLKSRSYHRFKGLDVSFIDCLLYH